MTYTKNRTQALATGLFLVLLLLAGDAGAYCYPDGATQACNQGVCLGTSTCNDYWTPCEATGESTLSCSVCGRQGTVRCDENFQTQAGTCSAYLDHELCNGCDDDGDGLIDEDIAPLNPPHLPCYPNSQTGCAGDMRCVNGGWQCVVRPNEYMFCGDQCGGSARRACLPDGSLDICKRDVSAAEDCNGCDDDRDGIVDNLPGKGPGSLTRACVGPSGSCPGSTETCVNGRWSGVCTAPPETCNGLDDNCNGSIDENGVCRADSLTCSCAPTTCAAQGATCGSIPDGCGGTLNCGGCGSNQACSSNRCVPVCTPTTCAAQGATCGAIPDGCGGTLNCGGCGANQVCSGNQCVPVCTPTTCAAQGRTCGLASDGCGGTLNCGTCDSGNQCVSTGVCLPNCPRGEVRCCDNSCSMGKYCDPELCGPPGQES